MDNYESSAGQTPAKSPLNIPVAIVIAGALIAGAVLYNSYTTGTSVRVVDQIVNGEQPNLVLPGPSAKDHILGNPTAKVVLIEYSDTSCPFCKTFHSTMKRIIDEYGKSGDVAWVYRHYPLDTPDSTGFVLHPNARTEAHALECAADLGGNDKFWAYINRLYDITPSVTQTTPSGLSMSELPKIAEHVGIDRAAFDACMSSGKYKEKINAQALEGQNAGVLGTPFTFAVTKSGRKVPINGAQPYNSVKAIIETLISAEN